MSTRPTVFVVDDDEGVRTALRILLESVGYAVALFASADEFLETYDPVQPGCLLLDVRMPEKTGPELQQELVARGAFLPVIFITGHGDVPIAVQAMQRGAFDFLQKPFSQDDLLARIAAAMTLDEKTRLELTRTDEIRRREAQLTPRERQVMAAIVGGSANKVIALDLNLSERTVEIHRARVMRKMGARSIAHLVRMALEIAP
jgi:FixJ family two-component response regulator